MTARPSKGGRTEDLQPGLLGPSQPTRKSPGQGSSSSSRAGQSAGPPPGRLDSRAIHRRDETAGRRKKPGSENAQPARPERHATGAKGPQGPQGADGAMGTALPSPFRTSEPGRPSPGPGAWQSRRPPRVMRMRPWREHLELPNLGQYAKTGRCQTPLRTKPGLTYELADQIAESPLEASAQKGEYEIKEKESWGGERMCVLGLGG